MSDTDLQLQEEDRARTQERAELAPLLVSVDGASKSFGDKVALKNASPPAPAGRICLWIDLRRGGFRLKSSEPACEPWSNA